jgi:hypothetical protein
MGLLLPSKSSWPKIAVSALQGYTEDKATAIAFEAPFKWRVILVVVLVFGGWILCLALYAVGLSQQPGFKEWIGVAIEGGFIAGIILAVIHIRTLAHSRPTSLQSHAKLKVYWRSDNPPGIVRQAVYVCETSKTYFTRTFLLPGGD